MRKPNYRNSSNYGSPHNLKNDNLPLQPSTPSSFERQVEDQYDTQTRTAYNRIRSYDVTVDKIDLKIPGAAPIFGSKNRAELLTWKSDIKANYTGSLNEVYAKNDFAVPAVQSRRVELKYQGLCHRAKIYSKAGNLVDFDPNNDKAVNLWDKNMVTLLNELDAAQYRDLKIFDIQYADTNTDAKLIKWRKALSQPVSMVAWLYQLEISAFLTILISYQYLVAAMPKLAELFPNKAGHFNFLQNKLKTTTFTAPVRSMMVDLKKRFIDKNFFKSFVLPCSIISQEMDGINSPLTYAVQVQTILHQKFKFKGEDVEYQFNTYAIDSDFNTNIYTQRTLDAFTLDTVLDLILRRDNDIVIKETLEDWLSSAKESILLAASSLLDFARNPITIAFETGLAKLSVAPGNQFNWSQNIDFSEIRNVDRFQYWELVDTIVNFNASSPKFNPNGNTLT